MLPAQPPRPRRIAHLAPVALAAAAAVLAPAPGGAQISPAQLERDAGPTISPRSGPPGTEVTVRASELPATSIMLVGVGVVGGGGHQMVGRGETDGGGDFELVVNVPDWAEAGTSHYFFLASADQRPRAMADVFLVADGEGLVRLTGEVGEDLGPCGRTLVQGDETFGLLGDVAGLVPGERVTVEGTVAGAEGCEDALTVRVRRVVSGR